MIFGQGSQIGKQHIDEKFLKNRNRSSTREFFHGKAAFQFFIFGFHRPAIKIKFLKHCLCDERIEKVGSEIFFCAVIKSDFNDTDINVSGTILGIAWKKGMDVARTFFARLSLSLRRIRQRSVGKNYRRNERRSCSCQNTNS